MEKTVRAGFFDRNVCKVQKHGLELRQMLIEFQVNESLLIISKLFWKYFEVA